MEDFPIEEKPVLSPEVLAALKQARQAIYDRSFMKRNSELGKMINCRICDLRHRSSQVCHQRFVKELTPPEGLTGLTIKQVVGAAAFKGKRINPHHSHKLLQLLQKTAEIFPLNLGNWPSTETKSAEQVAMEVSRREAKEILFQKRKKKRIEKVRQQNRSRRINNGLIEGNSRSGR